LHLQGHFKDITLFKHSFAAQNNEQLFFSMKRKLFELQQDAGNNFIHDNVLNLEVLTEGNFGGPDSGIAYKF